ncbi:Origin of replication binding protein [uncultured virus]|nr:Origin of replication binding protein [uncultured virus]
MDGIKLTTQSPSKQSTPPGVPIINSPNLYTTYQSLEYVKTYSKKNKVPPSSGILFAKDHIYPNSTQKKSRFFRMEYPEFFNRLLVTPVDKRIYYECIEGDRRKPYSDIEYEYTDTNQEEAFNNFDLIISGLLLGITYEMHAKGVPYNEERDCIKLSSHGFDPFLKTGKLSIHIIINNRYFDKCGDVHNSNVKNFWLAVRNYVPQHLWHFVKIDQKRNHRNVQHEVGETIDTCVYSSFRQMRLIWNTKLGKNRFLDIDPSTSLQARFPKLPGDPDDMSENLQRLRLFEACLITMTSNCQLLPDWNGPANHKQQVGVKNMVDLTNEQKVMMTLKFNNSDFCKHYRLDETISTSKNAIYMVPLTKPVWCDIHHKHHKNNNAKLCLSARKNVYVSCFSQSGGNKIKFLDKNINDHNVDPEIDSDIEDEEFDDNENNRNNEILPGMSLDEETIQFLHQQGHQSRQQNLTIPRRVQAHPIILRINNDDKVITQVHNGINNDFVRIDKSVVDGPIINIQTTFGLTPSMKEGQILIPTITTTFMSFLHGNTKYVSGSKYNDKDLYDAYERYRDGKGSSYNFRNGQFGKMLKQQGHFIETKRIKGGDRQQLVTLKYPDPIVTTNPVEALNTIPGKQIATTPVMSPENALNLLKNTPTTTIEQPAEPINNQQNLRLMNKHVDVRNFFDVYLTQDAEAETDRDNLYLCFINYCKDNDIVPERFGKISLINYYNRYLVKPGDNGFNGQVLKGWRCKMDKEEINNTIKEKNLRKIWEWNVTPYMIGWHNGKINERYDKKMTSHSWKKIDVHYRNQQHVKPIPELIEMTNAFEKSLPDRVKEIQRRQFELLLFPGNQNLNKEINNLQTLVINSLLSNVFTEGSEEHVILKNRIEVLTTEALTINREEYQRLENSIKDDKDRLRNEISWCIAVRSTFGTGKTFQLRPYIEAFPEMKVLIVLPRISLTDDYMREMRELGFEIYTDNKFKGKINGNRIIVCFPSLPRVRGEFDLFVLDEYKAIKDLLHTLIKKMRQRDRISGRYKSKDLKCYRALCQHIANTKRVYIADALLTNAHVLEIAAMRRQSENFNKRVTVYQNLFQKHKGNIVYTVDNDSLLVDKIIKFIREGKRVAVPTNCKESFAEFLQKKVTESGLNVTMSLTTSDNKATAPVQELWRDIQLIIFTPTILAGNSYNDAINVVCGYFTNLSCDQADAMQMLMRFRNVTSKEYYICVKQGPGKCPIPSNICKSPKEISIEEIKKFLMGISKNDVKTWAEEYKLPIDMIEFDYQKGIIKEKDEFFISYANYMKQCLVADREYLFRMLLYMRDAGFNYGGNIYTMTKDKEAVALIKQEKKEFSKERAEADLEEKYTCDDITSTEYSTLNKKPNKTKDDLRKLLKYRIKRKYNINNVPKWLFKIDKKNSKQYTRIRRYLELNGIVDQKQRYELMIKIDQDLLYIEKSEVTVPNQNEVLTRQLQQANTIYNASEDIENFWTKLDIELCENALKILEIIGATEFIRNVPRFEIRYSEFNNVTKLKDYIDKKEKELRELVNDFKIKIDNLASKITNKAFGIKFKMTPSSFVIDNMWILNPHNLMVCGYPALWPHNNDLNDREELRIFIPEPTITDKTKTWIDKTVMRNQVQLLVLTPPKVTSVIAFIPQVKPPARAIMNNNNLINLKAIAPIF